MSEKKKEQKCPEGVPDWMLTFGDLNSLLLTFFVMLLATLPIGKSDTEMQLILSAFTGSFGLLPGGQTLSPGKLAEMGNTMESLPSTDKGKSMAKQVREAVSLFHTEIKNKKVRVDVSERGITVSLSADAFFRPASAELDIDTARSVLEKVAQLITKTEYRNNEIIIEGFTDNSPTDPYGPWPTNWDLSVARSLNVLNYLVDFGAEPSKLSVMGYGEYKNMYSNDTEEGRSKNRRVDVLIKREK